jgi:hypothetical protein
MLGNIGGLIATWSYLPRDTPHYRIGNGLNLATSSSILVLGLATLVWMKRDNRKREKWTTERGSEHLTGSEAEKLDWKNPDFRWAI